MESGTEMEIKKTNKQHTNILNLLLNIKPNMRQRQQLNCKSFTLIIIIIMNISWM